MKIELQTQKHFPFGETKVYFLAETILQPSFSKCFGVFISSLVALFI